MCTVSYVPVGQAAFLTSNRDEQLGRARAVLPGAANFSSGKMLYPADGKAGGTWIACHENGNAMVLLNGGFLRHRPAPPYLKSRGLIFLEVFNDSSPSAKFLSVDLSGIEPFTLIIVEAGALSEARWDGVEKFLTVKDATVPYIWSSATLYEAAVQERREVWFSEWLNECPQPTLQAIMAFHLSAGDGDSANNLRMNREGVLQTVSITSVGISRDHIIMHYQDLLAGLTSVNDWQLSAIRS